MSKITTILDLKILGTEKLVNLEKEIQKTESALKGLDKADKKNAKTIAEKRVALKGLRSERNQEQKTVLAVNTATKKLDGSYNSLVARNKALLTSLKASKGGMKGNSQEIKKMKAEYLKNNEELKKFDSSIGNNQRNVGNYSSAMGKLKTGLASVGLAIGGAMVAFQALSRAVGVLTVDFGAFEKGLTNVLTLMDSGTIEQFQGEMKDGMLNIISQYGFAIDDVSKAMFDSVSAGVDAGNSVEFMNAASELALGGVTDLSTAVDGMTSVMNAYGLSASDANQIASAFFTGQKFGKTTVEELSNSIGGVIPHAKRAGVSYQELISAMSVLTTQGIKTDLSATALKSTITALENPSENAKKQFTKLGISYGTTALKSEGLMKILTQISAAGEENADVLSELIPNIRALTGVSALGGEQLEQYDEILREVNGDYGENSSLANAVEKQQDTLQQSQARLNGEWTTQKILLGEESKPIFIAMNDALSFLIKNLDTVWAIVKGVTVAFVAYNFAAIVQIAKTGIQTAATWLQVMAQRALNTAMKANPILLLISLGAGLAASYSSMSKETDKATDSQNKLNKAQQEAAEKEKALQQAQKQREESQASEITKVKLLINNIKDETKSKEDRLKAVQDLNQVAGTNITNIDNETRLMKDLDDAYKNAVESIKAKYIMQEAEAEILEIVKKELQHKEDVNSLDKTAAKEQEKINGLLKQKIALEQQIAKGIEDKKEEAKVTRKLTSTKDQLAHAEKRLAGMKKASAHVDNLANKRNADSNEIMAEAQKKIDDLDIKIGKVTKNKKKQATAYEKLRNAVTDATKALKAEIIAGGDTTKATQDLKDAKEDLAKIDEEFEKLSPKKAETQKSNIQLLEQEITATTKNVKLLEGNFIVQKEFTNEKIKLLKQELELIMLQAQATGELGDVQLQNIENIKKQLATLNSSLKNEETGMSPFQEAFYGEGVQSAFAGLDASMGMLTNSMQGRAAMAKTEFDNEMFHLETAKNTELSNFDKSARASKMTEEQKTKAREKIANKHDGVITALKKEEFERVKKLNVAEARMAGAQAIMNIWGGKITGNPIIDAIIKGGLILTQLGNTNKQIKAINTQEFKGEKGGLIPQFKNGGMVRGNSHANGGVKFNVGGTVAELEGGEAVINKRSTSMFRDQLSAMNVAGGGKRFADGGLVLGALEKAQTRSLLTEQDLVGIAGALSHQRVTVTEADITGTQNTINVLEARASF